MADIITYPENGITYDADDASGYLATRQSGVYSAEEDFAVSISGELSLTVSAGQAWVRPARFRGRSIIMEQPTTLALTAADPVRTRIDRVVLRYDAAARQTRLQVLEGTPDSASPTAPAITRTALVYDLCLAEITRPAGSTAITAADITDTRADEDVCGVMRDGVTGIPTAELVAHYNAILTAMQQSGNAQLQQLAAAIASVDSGSFYTKSEADAKFGTPFTLTPATADTLGGIKVGDYLDIDASGTLSGKTLNDKIAAAVAAKSAPRLVWSGKVTHNKTSTDTVPDGVDYVNIKIGSSRDFNLTPGMSYKTTSEGPANPSVTVDFSKDKKSLTYTFDYAMNGIAIVFTGYHYPTIAELLTETQAAVADSDAVNVDQEYRLTLLELGVTDTDN